MLVTADISQERRQGLERAIGRLDYLLTAGRKYEFTENLKALRDSYSPLEISDIARKLYEDSELPISIETLYQLQKITQSGQELRAFVTGVESVDITIEGSITSGEKRYYAEGINTNEILAIDDFISFAREKGVFPYAETLLNEFNELNEQGPERVLSEEVARQIIVVPEYYENNPEVLEQALSSSTQVYSVNSGIGNASGGQRIGRIVTQASLRDSYRKLLDESVSDAEVQRFFSEMEALGLSEEVIQKNIVMAVQAEGRQVLEADVDLDGAIFNLASGGEAGVQQGAISAELAVREFEDFAKNSIGLSLTEGTRKVDIEAALQLYIEKLHPDAAKIKAITERFSLSV